MSDNEIVFINNLKEFDAKKLKILDPVKNSFSRGGSTIEWVTSEGRYLNNEGKPCELYFALPEAFCFGVNGNYKFGTEKEDQIPENLTGFQICYPLTSMKTIENPTESEKHVKSVFDALFNAVWKKMQEECEKDDLQVPNPSYSACLAAQKKKNPTYAVKPVYSHKMVYDKKTKKKEPDMETPARTYIKLLTKGKGRKMRCQSLIYGPGDKQDKTGLKYIDVRGNVMPVIKWDGVFWGSHGQKAPYGASVRLRVSEMNFTPQSDGAPPRRMLNANTSPKELDISDDDENIGYTKPGSKDDDDQSGEDEGFGDDVNPVDGLRKKTEENDSDDDSESNEEEESEPKKKTKKKLTMAQRRKLALKKKRARKSKK